MSTDGNSVVRSLCGLERVVCDLGADCERSYCAHAHPNMSGSIVKHPKWCLYGPVDKCVNIMCPFNHFKYEIDWVNYRKNDEKWAWENINLVVKYTGSSNGNYSKYSRVPLTYGEYMKLERVDGK